MCIYWQYWTSFKHTVMQGRFKWQAVPTCETCGDNAIIRSEQEKIKLIRLSYIRITFKFVRKGVCMVEKCHFHYIS